MQFLELTLQNFGPYQGKQIIDLNPQNNENKGPIVLFGGMNGGGKTTLMDAIRLALYGIRAQCSTRGNLSYSDFLIQSINRHKTAEGARIELAFQHIQNNEIKKVKIVRYWYPILKDGKDTLGILIYSDFLGDWEKDDALTETWDEYIETLLPLGISNLFLFDGEQVKELAEMETPPETVTGAIKSLLGLELAEKLGVHLEILLNRKRKQVADAEQKITLDKIEEKLKELNSQKQSVKEELNTHKTNLERAESKQQKASQKFLTEGGKIAAERSHIEQKHRTLIQQAETIRQAMAEEAAGVLPLALITPLLKNAQTQAQKETTQISAKIALEAMNQRNKRLLNYLNEITLKPQQIDKIQSFLDEENQTLEEQAKSTEKPWLNADEETQNQMEILLKYDIKNSQNSAIEKLEQLKKIEIEIDNTDRTLAAAASPEAYEKLENNLQEAQKEVARQKVNYENANRQLEEIQKQIIKIQKDLQDYSDQHIANRNNQHIISAIGRVQNTLNEFKQKITLKKLNKLETETTECFRYLLHKNDLVHRVVIDTNTFSLSLYDPQGKSVPKHRISAGEKQLLAIAFLWGLARVSGRQLPIAIDTPLGRLDSSHRYNLVEKYFPSASHQVILLSTDTEIGENEIKKLREQETIAQEYLLKYDPTNQQTVIKKGYFW
ncbi:MAG TPA: DNA sulfur modification protein DndD [Halomicronema sp.]